MKIKRKENAVTLLPKVMLLIAFGFGVKLFFSCTPNSQDPIEINFNAISLIGIDNSERYVNSSYSDTLFADAVALKITLSDTAGFYATSSSENLMHALSFQTLKADDISPSFIPRNKVVDIKVKTLMDINGSLKAGDDISEHVLCLRGSFDLYYNLNHGIAWLNGIQSFSPGSSLIIVLKTAVENLHAQFEVNVTLENGDELMATTMIFTIIES